ncbi:MAG: MarR family transcriptional regulator [Bacteroidetes bacterium]|nr:MAG: MarR family transcriptional regulator [Bacteroidota bacterium]
MNFFNEVGKKGIGTRLRLLTEKITEDAAHLYKLYKVDLEPKWWPVFYLLSTRDEMAITEIAREIGHSHPSISKIIREMSAKELVIEKKDKTDGRRNIVSLSKKGKQLVEKIQDQYRDVDKAIEEILSKTRNNLWKAIEEWEFMLEQKTLLRRVMEQKKIREGSDVEIVEYTPKYRKAFKELNEEWIYAYFDMEEADRKALDNPKGYILDKGGCILVALLNGKPVGVCALKKMEDPEYDYELAKMAVSSEARGKGIGWLLGKAAIAKAKDLGAKRIYLESNTRLEAAINLYHKMGFQKVVGHATPYERCNIQMGLSIS